MERERGGPLPTNFDQAADPELIATFPKRILRILNRQLDRFDAKTRNGKNLSTDDLDRLKRVSAICRDLERKNRAYDPTPRGALTQRPTEATLASLASSIPVPQDRAGGDSPSPIVPAHKPTSEGQPGFPDPLRRRSRLRPRRTRTRSNSSFAQSESTGTVQSSTQAKETA